MLTLYHDRGPNIASVVWLWPLHELRLESELRVKERCANESMFNQANNLIGTVSRATLGGLLRDGAERILAFPSVAMPS